MAVESLAEMLSRLSEVDNIIAREVTADWYVGLFAVGLGLHKQLKNCGYWCTPRNSLAFASTGGDGVHYSVLAQDGKPVDDSPVIMTVPTSDGYAPYTNLIVGDTVRNFLRFGLIRGYFYMEQLKYQRQTALAAYSSADWQPGRDHRGFGISERDKAILAILARELKIVPLSYTESEFDAMQERHSSKLEYDRLEF